MNKYEKEILALQKVVIELLLHSTMPHADKVALADSLSVEPKPKPESDRWNF